MFLAACIFSAALCCSRVEAGGNTGFDLIENADDTADKEVTEIPVRTGILLVQNLCGRGDLELTCSAGFFTAEWDYSEMELPLGEICVLRVIPHEGYAADKVTVDGEELEPGADGSYSLALENEMTELSVSYVVCETPAVTDEEMPGDAGEDMQEEKAAKKLAAVPADDSGEQFASDISYDVTVSYEEEDDTRASETEPADADDVTEADEDGAPVFDADAEIIFPSEMESVPKKESSFDLNSVPEPAEESGERTKPHEPEKPSGEKTGTVEEALAALPERPDDEPEESAARPAAADMAALPELRDADSSAWDGNLAYVLFAGAVLSVSCAYIVKRH